MDEQLYIFVDKTGHCFEDFQISTSTKDPDEIDELLDDILPVDDGERHYRGYVGAMMRSGHKFTVGDMMCFKQDLEDAGFKWGKDFYVKKA